MLIPPNIWEAVAAEAAASAERRIASAERRIKEAQQKYADRRRRYEETVRRYEEKHACVASRFEDLGKTRLEAVATLGEAVKFLDEDGIRLLKGGS